MLYLALVIPRLFRERAFLHVRYLQGAFLKRQFQRCVPLQGDPYKLSILKAFSPNALSYYNTCVKALRHMMGYKVHEGQCIISGMDCWAGFLDNFYNGLLGLITPLDCTYKKSFQFYLIFSETFLMQVINYSSVHSRECVVPSLLVPLSPLGRIQAIKSCETSYWLLQLMVLQHSCVGNPCIGID